MSRMFRIALVVVALVSFAQPAQARAPINDVYVIHLILDGINYNTFMGLVVAGKLPTIESTFFNNGAVFTKGISTFPSTSTSAYQSFITGLMPGHAGIPHLQRFDRQKREIIDYLSIGKHAKVNGDLINLNALLDPKHADLDTPTIIYELLDGHSTLALYTSIRRGAAMAEPALMPLHAAWSAYVSERTENIDVLAFDRLMKHYGGPLEDIPRFAQVGLYSSDVTGHHDGADSSTVHDVLIQFDYFLREFLALLDTQGIRDKTYIIVSADHGMHNTDLLFRLREAAIERGISVKPMNPRIRDFTFYAADRGVSSTHIYTRRPDGTFEPLDHADELGHFPLADGGSVDLVEFIRSLEATELIAVRDGEQAVIVHDHEGNASRIACFLVDNEHWCGYRIISGDDPLRLSTPHARRLMDGKPHSSQEWKHAAADEYYVDGVMQLGTIFQDGRAGDLFVIPKERWGFRAVKHATHGSLIEPDMHIPIFIAGPDVPHGTFGIMRTVDVYPLLLQWFGLKQPTSCHDGVDPFEPYRHEDAIAQRLATLEQTISDDHENAAALRRLTDDRQRALMRLARAEMRRRSELEKRLNVYIEELEQQQRDTTVPEITANEYLDDHLAIAKRMQRLTSRRKEAMQRIVELMGRKT